MNRHAPAYQNRTPDQITSGDLHFDSAGYLFRAVSWLDYFDRTRHYTALLYACAEGRMGIEYLLFEELVVSTGARLSRHDYERCVGERGKFKKLIRQLSPDHHKSQEFTRVVMEITPGSPKVIYWELADLERQLGTLSRYIHWSGHRTETTEDDAWLGTMRENVAEALLPIWKKMSTGQSGVLHPDNMTPLARAVWDEFKYGRIDIEQARIRLQIMRPATWPLI